MIKLSLSSLIISLIFIIITLLIIIINYNYNYILNSYSNNNYLYSNKNKISIDNYYDNEYSDYYDLYKDDDEIVITNKPRNRKPIDIITKTKTPLPTTSQPISTNSLIISTISPSNTLTFSPTNSLIISTIAPSNTLAFSPILESLPYTFNFKSVTLPPIYNPSYVTPIDKPNLPYRFPIVVLTHSRHVLLYTSLLSLLNLHGINETCVVVSCDGNNDNIKDIVSKFNNVKLIFNNENNNIKDGATRISLHYKYTLNYMFDHYNSDYLIIVEDDMIFSPDFLDFFAQTYKLYEDSNTYCISTWNDNGFSNMARDSTKLLRTDFFPGLGWLASKKIYNSEWRANWPKEHWDHFLRNPNNRRGRECIYPEVSRNYNIGVLGTHSSTEMFDQFFRYIVLNQNFPVSLNIEEVLTKDKYIEFENKLIARGRIISGPKELESAHAGEILLIYYGSNKESDKVWELHIAPFFHLWHSIPFIRTMRDGIVRFWYKGKYLLIIANYSSRKRDGIVLWDPSTFVFVGDVKIEVGYFGQSCTTVCKIKSLTCIENKLVGLNNCDTAMKYLGCTKCDYSNGPDQPAIDRNKLCLLNGGKFSCSGSHEKTSRVCPCGS